MFRATKNKLEIEVSYYNASINVQAVAENEKHEKLWKAITRSEALIAETLMSREKVADPEAWLQQHFEGHGWTIDKTPAVAFDMCASNSVAV